MNLPRISTRRTASAKACEEAAEGQVVSPVNFNSPGQVVIAGHKEAVERAGAACKAAGAKRALPLPVSVPSHCALMKPAADKLAVELAKITFNAPTVPVVNNVDVKCETNGDAIRDALIEAPEVKALSFVGSTPIAEYIYAYPGGGTGRGAFRLMFEHLGGRRYRVVGVRNPHR